MYTHAFIFISFNISSLGCFESYYKWDPPCLNIIIIIIIIIITIYIIIIVTCIITST